MWHDRLCLTRQFPNSRPDPIGPFALGFQARRAFHHIFRQILGDSLPAARLRASVWQSIFTYDARRYREHLYDRMADMPTLITGESGTGKELVARAIARSLYVPFDRATKRFAADPAVAFPCREPLGAQPGLDRGGALRAPARSCCNATAPACMRKRRATRKPASVWIWIRARCAPK